ncbi:MAG TPA: AroB-related putative sugar phosphate phospholyase (cyclizing) [Candidatus Sulfotelmatobacter sp.]|nr:AroB-related putative sugar phosphate phospholyase (cyclizing) [Candidatus Sulfotelmatobacter sp.]
MSDQMVIESHTGPYSVHFDEAGLDRVNASVPDQAHFIIDSKVAELYRHRMGNILASPNVLLIEANEGAKSLERFPAYVEKLVSRKLRRDHHLVAIGGGVIQDIACFLAATMLRGVDWQFFPTTLLAQADSCIGSKSSINCGDAKNIMGTFTPPRQITISTDFLSTLDEDCIRSGIGEMLKVHVIAGPQAFDTLAADYDQLFNDRPAMIAAIRRSLEIKKGYIETDEFDRGPRLVFNYGHSFGHAIEAATEFAIPHGIAVTIGMDMANWTAWKLNVGSEENFRRMHPVLARNSRPYIGTPVPLQPFMAALSKDKKNVGSGSATLILPNRQAQVFKDAYAADDQFASLMQQYFLEFLQSFRGSLAVSQ